MTDTPKYRDEVVQYLTMIARSSLNDPEAQVSLIPLSRRTEDGPKARLFFSEGADLYEFYKRLRVAFPDPKIEGEGFVASTVHYTAAVVNDQMAPAGKHVCDIYQFIS